MRIIGNIDHPSMKITVFQLDTKFMVKFEQHLFEITYKFRKGPLVQSLKDIKTMLDEPFLDQVMMDLAKMNVHCNSLYQRSMNKTADEDWDEII